MPDKVRDLRIKEKFMVDDAYLNGYARVCGIYATGVYLALCRHCSKNQLSFPGIDLISEKLSISRPSVIRAIAMLEKYNIIKVTRGKDKQGRQKSNVYILLDKSIWKPARVNDRHPGPGQPQNKTGLTSEQNRVNEVDCKVKATIKDTHIREGEKKPSCPFGEIVKLYHEILPELPMVKELTETRKRQLKTRWFAKKNRQSLDWWQKYFEYVRESSFLMGQANTSGRKFQANLEWLTKESNFVKVIESQYHN